MLQVAARKKQPVAEADAQSGGHHVAPALHRLAPKTRSAERASVSVIPPSSSAYAYAIPHRAAAPTGGAPQRLIIPHPPETQRAPRSETDGFRTLSPSLGTGPSAHHPQFSEAVPRDEESDDEAPGAHGPVFTACEERQVSSLAVELLESKSPQEAQGLLRGWYRAAETHRLLLRYTGVPSMPLPGGRAGSATAASGDAGRQNTIEMLRKSQWRRSTAPHSLRHDRAQTGGDGRAAGAVSKLPSGESRPATKQANARKPISWRVKKPLKKQSHLGTKSALAATVPPPAATASAASTVVKPTTPSGAKRPPAATEQSEPMATDMQAGEQPEVDTLAETSPELMNSDCSSGHPLSTDTNRCHSITGRRRFMSIQAKRAIGRKGPTFATDGASCETSTCSLFDDDGDDYINSDTQHHNKSTVTTNCSRGDSRPHSSSREVDNLESKRISENATSRLADGASGGRLVRPTPKSAEVDENGCSVKERPFSASSRWSSKGATSALAVPSFDEIGATACDDSVAAEESLGTTRAMRSLASTLRKTVVEPSTADGVDDGVTEPMTQGTHMPGCDAVSDQPGSEQRVPSAEAQYSNSEAFEGEEPEGSHAVASSVSNVEKQSSVSTGETNAETSEAESHAGNEVNMGDTAAADVDEAASVSSPVDTGGEADSRGSSERRKLETAVGAKESDPSSSESSSGNTNNGNEHVDNCGLDEGEDGDDDHDDRSDASSTSEMEEEEEEEEEEKLPWD